MPRVRAYGPQRVQLNPLPNQRKETGAAVPSADAFGAAAGRGMAALGDTAIHAGTQGLSLLSEQAAQRRTQADQVAVLAAKNQLDGWVTTRLYDPEAGALTTVRGKAALDLSHTVGAEFDEAAGKIAGTLKTPRQQLGFEAARLNTWQNTYQDLERHAATEFANWQKQETATGIENAYNAAVANATDPRRVSDEMGIGLSLVQDHAKALGMGPEATQAARDAFTTKLHTGVIENLLATEHDKAATIYYEETKDQISGEAQARIETAIDEGKLRGESQRQADAIRLAGGSASAQLDTARAIEDPKLRDAVVQRVEHDLAIGKAAERDRVEQTMIAAANLIDTKGTVRAIPPAVWTSLTVGERTSLEQYAKRNQAGGVETNWGTYYALSRMASNPDTQDSFAELNLLKYLPQLGKAEFKQMAEIQASVRKKDGPNTDKLLVSERTQNEIVNDAMLSIGVDPTPLQPGSKNYDKAMSDRVVQFRRSVRDAVSAHEAQTQKKATDNEVQDIVDTLIARTAKGKTHWFSKNEPDVLAFESAGVVASVADVPASERRLIEAALTRAGRPITDAAVLALFNAHLQTVRKR